MEGNLLAGPVRIRPVGSVAVQMRTETATKGVNRTYWRNRLAIMDIRAQHQLNPVADEVSALVAVVRPILVGLVWGLKAEVAAEVDGAENVKLRMLPRLRRRGDGDLGICFE
jgi:hypothetical protein